MVFVQMLMLVLPLDRALEPSMANNWIAPETNKDYQNVPSALILPLVLMLMMQGYSAASHVRQHAPVISRLITGIWLLSRAALCQNGALRIQGGATPLTGRLEVCYNEDWGSVCENNWDDMDASVACGQLGFAPVGKAVSMCLSTIS